MKGEARIGRLSAVAAFVLLAALGLRTQTTIDLGYHLAYGEIFLDSGRIVDHNDFLYTLPDLSSPDRPAPGPGSWYDAAGRYRFANANWLSQVVMALAWRAGGAWGAGLLGLALVGVTAGLLFATVRRWGVASPGPCLVLVLFALVAYSRLNLRPELFGYAVLALQLRLLAPFVRDGQRGAVLPRRTAVALVVSQALFVNLHSYFLLGIGLVGALFLEAFLRWWLSPGVDLERRDALGKAAFTLARTGLGMAAVCLLNPWTWRLAVLPIRTVIYMNVHHIGRGPGEHPWSHIMEFRRTLARDLGAQVHDWALLVLVLLALVGSWGLVRSRRWAALLILLAGLSVSLSMWRNLPPGALMLTPVAIAGCAAIVGPVAGRLRSVFAAARLILSLTLVAVAVVSTAFVVSSRWYHRQGYDTRFGVGVSRVAVPLGAAEWLDGNLPGARIWCDLSSSSNLHWYTLPHRELPILSNTWAYPPAVMQESRRYRAVAESFETAVRRYGIEAVVLRTDWSQPLYMELAAHPDWELVHVEGLHAVLALARGPRSTIVRAAGSSLLHEDPQQLLGRLIATDPFPDTALFWSGTALNLAGLYDHAIALFDHVVERQPSNAEAWQRLGSGFSARGTAKRVAGRPDAQADLERAERCYQRASELR